MENYPERPQRPTLNGTDRSEASGTHETPIRRAVAAASRREASDKKYIKKALLGVAALAVVVGLVWGVFMRGGLPSYIDTGKYQVACLQSGECYFGKVNSMTSDVLVIKDVFYVQKSTSATDTKTATANNLELIKLGNEVHGPEDMMAISRSQILYVENLKSDGKVAQTIQKYHQDNK